MTDKAVRSASSRAKRSVSKTRYSLPFARETSKGWKRQCFHASKERRRGYSRALPTLRRNIWSTFRFGTIGSMCVSLALSNRKDFLCQQRVEVMQQQQQQHHREEDGRRYFFLRMKFFVAVVVSFGFIKGFTSCSDYFLLAFCEINILLFQFIKRVLLFSSASWECYESSMKKSRFGDFAEDSSIKHGQVIST